LTNSGAGGHFIATNATNMNVGANSGFGLWANNGGISTATRDFTVPMAAGDSFALRFDNNWVNTGSEVGFALTDSAGTVKLRFFFVGGQSNYRITDAITARDSGLAYTNGGLNLTLTLNSGNAYTLSGGGTNITGNLAAVGGAISRLVVENKNAGPDTPYNLYIGAMTHTRQVADSGTVSINAPALTFGGSAQTDGLPNSWWSTYFENPSDWVAGNDADGDGFTNAQEYALGTDPTSHASAFRITSVNNNGGTSTVEWSSVSGKKYRLQSKANLSDDWADAGSEVTADGATSSATHTAWDRHFYRVRLVP